MAFDIIRGHSLGIHGDDLFFHILSDGILILFDDLRFKLTFPVSWDIDLHIAVTGMHGLLGCLLYTSILFQDALHVVLRHHFSATFCSRIEKIIIRVLFGMVKGQ